MKLSLTLARVCLLLLILGMSRGVARAQVTEIGQIQAHSSGDEDFTIRDSAQAFHTTPVAADKPIQPHTNYVFTETDIARSSARDLMELLNTLPGISFGLDVAGALTIGIRGNVAGESTVMIVDGLILNEGMYATFQLSGKLNMDQLTRVEVIIGPSQILYGSWAAYGVINIQTRAFKPFTGVRTGWTQGFHNPNKDARVSASVSAGKQGPVWSLAASASVTSSVLSFNNFTDRGGNTYSMETNSGLYNRFASIQARRKNTSLTFISDVYQLNTRDAYGRNTTQAYRNDFITYGLTLRHTERIAPRITLRAMGSFKSQDPFKALSEVAQPDSGSYSKVWFRYLRMLSHVDLQYKVMPGLEIMLGAQAARDWGFDLLGDGYFTNSHHEKWYDTYSILGQGTYTYRNTRMFAGFRNDNHSYAGALFSPTLALSQSFGDFYGKFSVSRDRRLPSLLNIDLAEGRLKTQIVTTGNIELGYQHPRLGVSVGVNLFRNTTENAVLYQVNLEGEEQYVNSRPYATRGFELFARKDKGKFRYRLGYSLYTNHVRGFFCIAHCVPGTTENIGLPAHKGVLVVSGQIVKDLDFSFTGICEAAKSGVVGPAPPGSEGSPFTYKRYPAQLTANLFLHYHVNIAQGVDISTGIVDILNANVKYVQPYAGNHMPLPGPGREYIIRVCYALQR